ncbi:hypothetical protein KKC67_00545 [Patescibacteria group bacterium]|nr:hypothetical protein [Patescibacteria group bacterium]MBU0879265.1 hypothetical protein [Patescibacteria group bacterium]MBU0880502.1 hypothetical protein [Patescibacteria group bacterium]MBU1062824.1 hypothetical protein [Patescibacteria group bacterium]MBU1783500.1 hypothetical protein [Patescibacteria group bacterium]
MKKIIFLIFALGIVFFGFNLKATLARASVIEDIKDVPVKNDFVLGPGKIELWMNPGETATKELMITNRIGKTMDFQINIEDFGGSRDSKQTVVFFGDKESPKTSLKNYLKPELTKFTLMHGQRMILPIEVSIPQDAEPGGRYGSILVTSSPYGEDVKIEKEKATGQISLNSRLGALFFIRVKGDVIEDGSLKEIKTTKMFYEKAPISFELLFENNGSIHLLPYGVVEIKNFFNKKIGEINLDPWYVMPDSLRLREVKWNSGWLFGKYTASVSINRGYKDIIDQKSIDFWVIPWRIILIGLTALFLIVWFFKWVIGHFEIKVKDKSVKDKN